MEFIEKYVHFFNDFIAIYLLIYTIYIFVSSLCGAIIAVIQRRRNTMRNYLQHDYYYPISIIVPAYNEGISIVQTINNLLKLDYHRYEIVVVDDGSKDDTKQKVLSSFPLKVETARPIRYQVKCQKINEVYSCMIGDITLTLISKDNGGCKADAVNAGINISKYPYFVNMDGDEILQKDALKLACKSLLEEDNVIAIGGNIKISNDVSFKDAEPISGGLGNNPIVNMQILEYSRSFQGARVFQNTINANLIISGGYGIFRKDIVVAVGGYDPISKGEDMEMTVKLHKYCRKKKMSYSMKFVPESICWTQGPATIKDLKSQRQRWHCGLIQTLWKYKTMVLNPRYGVLGFFMLPYMIMYELLSPIIAVLGLVAIVMGFVIDPSTIMGSVTMFGIYILFGIVLTMISYIENRYIKDERITFKEILTVIGASIVDALFFRPYLAVINLLSFFKYKKITKSKWVSPSRVNIKED